MNEYIDVRGVWPVYVKGMMVITLEFCLHSITIEEAKTILHLQDR